MTIDIIGAIYLSLGLLSFGFSLGCAFCRAARWKAAGNRGWFPRLMLLTYFRGDGDGSGKITSATTRPG